MTVKIYNVLTHKKEDFQPIEKGHVRMYACGITVSGEAHIGHAYQSVVFDMISKYLAYKGNKVTYVRNYTDIDDKIIANAQKADEDPIAFAEKYMNRTNAEMDALGNTPPAVQPRATECIPEIIDFVGRLIDKGHAYATDSGDVYFKVSSFPEYGKLSRVQVNENEVAVRKDLEPDKENAADFALWKAAKPGEIYWESPWGRGRPGWHIECSAMNLANLGEQIDIHGGGRDLIFPHHENEIAQTEALTGKKFANFWIHCGMIKINGQKMSKSLGNGISIKDMLDKYDADVIRFALLRNTYSSDIDVTDAFFPEAVSHIYKMYSTLSKIPNSNENANLSKTNTAIDALTVEFEAAMDDNFNTSAAFAVIFKYMALIGAELAKTTSEYDLAKLAQKVKNLMAIFNILQLDAGKYVKDVKAAVLVDGNLTESEIESKIQKRNDAKANRDFVTADKIRAELLAKRIILQDSAAGTKWDIEL
jgi:cysteinyl-tRNA synthetase